VHSRGARLVVQGDRDLRHVLEVLFDLEALLVVLDGLLKIPLEVIGAANGVVHHGVLNLLRDALDDPKSFQRDGHGLIAPSPSLCNQRSIVFFVSHVPQLTPSKSESTYGRLPSDPRTGQTF